MPTEAELTAKVFAAVRQRWPRSWRWKINERTRSGIPDAYFLNDGIGVFVEFKKLKHGQSIDKKVTPIQKITLGEIDRANERRSVVVGFYPDGSQALFNAYLSAFPNTTTLLDYLMMVWG